MTAEPLLAPAPPAARAARDAATAPAARLGTTTYAPTTSYASITPVVDVDLDADAGPRADVEEILRSRPGQQYAGAALELYGTAPDPGAERRPVVGCVIPAYNEEGSIARVLEALLAQTRLPDVVHVIINNTTDDTFWVAREFAGRHERRYRGETMTCDVHVHDVGRLADRKVGALNTGFRFVQDCDYFLGVDGDTILHRRTLERLLAEIRSDRRIGGISAVYSIDFDEGAGLDEKFLIAGQRQQFAGFNLLNLLRGRNMAVIGGQCSIFSVEALTTVRDTYRQGGPWVSDSEVEDSLLSLQLKSTGFSTKISASARADVGPMLSLKSLDAQQVKWNYGAIDLMWPGQRGNTTGHPFHPNLRLRWLENWQMLFNLLVRVGFVLLLAASLSIGAFTFYWWWLLPPAVSILLNVRIALTMKDRTVKDLLFALLFVPGEIYMWIRIGHFVRAWTKFLSRQEVDNWGAQAAAESGRANNDYLRPVVYGVVLLALLVVGWLQLPLLAQEVVLWICWPALAMVAALQSVEMLVRLLRRHRGFRV
ncbi:glycosyltransferase family 2 protein [Georgenia sp. Z1344]|uniref:glycosyltransferase family 2 protein n=1 Tax=Georgenia sp. Z1344 TaxID=3416706 RepID=UPI003CF16EFA